MTINMIADDAIKQKRPVRDIDSEADNEMVLHTMGLSEASMTESVMSEAPSKVIETYLDPQTPAILDESTTLDHFIEIIKSRKIRSCVVAFKKKFLGCSRQRFAFVDVRDIAYFVMRMKRDWRARSFQEILEICRKSPLRMMANISNRSPFDPIDANAPFSALCVAFERTARVPVFSKGTLLRIVSPIDLLTVLRVTQAFGEVVRLSRLNRSLQPAVRPVTSLLDTESLLKGVNLLEKLGISSLPIVTMRNGSIQIRDVLTVSDVAKIFALSRVFPNKDFLNDTAMSYVEQLRMHVPYGRTPFIMVDASNMQASPGSPQSPPITAAGKQKISPDAAPATGSNRRMKQVLMRFSETLVSRMFLADASGRPSQMVTLSDIMKALAGQLGNPNVASLLSGGAAGHSKKHHHHHHHHHLECGSRKGSVKGSKAASRRGSEMNNQHNGANQSGFTANQLHAAMSASGAASGGKNLTYDEHKQQRNSTGRRDSVSSSCSSSSLSSSLDSSLVILGGKELADEILRVESSAVAAAADDQSPTSRQQLIGGVDFLMGQTHDESA